MSNKNVWCRAFSSKFETREENGLGIIEGRPIVYDSRADFEDFDEVIDRDALRDTDMTDVRLCLNHDTGYVYARSRRNNGNSTMQIYTDTLGLGFRAQLDIANSPKAQDFYSAVNRGDMDKMSFMFTVDGVEWDNLETDHPTRRITKIGTIFEISCVTFPAYENTSIEARNAAALDSVRRELENARAERLKTPDGDRALILARARYEYMKKFTERR